MAVLRLFAGAREAAGTGHDEVPGATVAEVLDAARTRYGGRLHRPCSSTARSGATASRASSTTPSPTPTRSRCCRRSRAEPADGDAPSGATRPRPDGDAERVRRSGQAAARAVAGPALPAPLRRRVRHRTVPASASGCSGSSWPRSPSPSGPLATVAGLRRDRGHRRGPGRPRVAAAPAPTERDRRGRRWRAR